MSEAANPFATNEKPHWDESVHIHKGVVCLTETRGHKQPQKNGRDKLVVDASEGFIPLWAKGQSLRWRFNEASMKIFQNPEAAKAAIEKLLADALDGWNKVKNVVPIRFVKNADVSDFEIYMQAKDDCRDGGCVLAQAFFPDAGRHKLRIWPKMFTQPRAEQVETLQHELGHAFGLRHFFAQTSETDAPSELWGKQDKFTIMNYGAASTLTDPDRSDLGKLYDLVWKGQLTEINGTPIKLLKPFHTHSQ